MHMECLQENKIDISRDVELLTDMTSSPVQQHPHTAPRGFIPTGTPVRTRHPPSPLYSLLINANMYKFQVDLIFSSFFLRKSLSGCRINRSRDCLSPHLAPGARTRQSVCIPIVMGGGGEEATQRNCSAELKRKFRCSSLKFY